jgi:broad specificity phosphatase PhoE
VAKVTLFYSPHMTSTDNEAGRASGHADVPLAPSGRQRAAELGQHYAAEALDAVFSSDLRRAYTTAEIAFGYRVPLVIRDARLRECDYGERTQCPRDELALEQHITEPYPGGESVQMVAERVGVFLNDLLRDYEGKRVVVISHAAPKYALEYWLGEPKRSLEEIVTSVWEWRDVPIWRYEVSSPLRA